VTHLRRGYPIRIQHSIPHLYGLRRSMGRSEWAP
jgi:hypothetical protein